jgi:16S rRNA (uracil1498-N3)-methyltransferase
MEYFYTPPHLISRDELFIEEEEFAHLSHVMRKKVGDGIRVVDGQGKAFDVIIAEMRKHTARGSITARHERLHEPAIDLTLGVGLLKNAARFDVMVEKATEIGINAIVPLHTVRTIPEHAKTGRWQKLALAAMKQAGRCVLPKVHEPMTLHDFLETPRHDALKLLPHEKERTSTITSLFPITAISTAAICIGPEGGFTDEEVAGGVAAGFRTVSLGPRRLRTETAAIVAAASLILHSPAHTSDTA